MGRHLERTLSGAQFEGSHPGCMWGIFHILDYHHWHYVKKILPHNKHSGGRHARCKVSTKTRLKKRDIEVQELMNSAAEPSLVEKHNTETCPASTKKRPGKACIKELIAEEMSKEEKHRYWNLSHAARIWLRRIIPVHHLEHSDKSLGEIHTDGADPIILLQKSENLVETDQLKGDVSNNQFKECVDVLEVFKVNKEYFLKILQEPNNSLQNSNPKARLTKSVSYPVPNSPPSKNIRPRTVKHKQNEGWPFPKGEKLIAASQASEFGASKSQKEYHLKSKSVDRYTELFGRSFGREAKWLHSKSLKLTNESKIPLSGRAPKSFRRRLSLPDLDSLCSFLNESSSDALSSEMLTVVDNDHCKEPKTVSTPVEAQTIEPIHAALETEFQKDMTQVIDSRCNIQSSDDLMEGGESILHQDQKIGLTIIDSRELAHPCTELAEPGPVSDLETCFPDDITSIAELPIYEGPDSFPAFCSIVTLESTENTNKGVENHFLHFHLDDAEFNYVRIVLELSGFIKAEHLGTWYSLDQPLNPSLFKELEALFHPELEDYGEEIDGSCDYHRPLFDLINDTLLEIYERSFTYFPRAFSFNHHIHPMPKGHHLLEEVLAKISKYLSLRPELDQSLDDIVARDLTKGDAWMNLQFDNECVTLELEDLIFDQLLDELICS